MFDFCNKNHCTCFVDSIFGVYIGDCCKQHDEDFYNQNISKEVADKKLFKCVRSKTNVVLASAMWIAVRTFGYIFWNRYKK